MLSTAQKILVIIAAFFYTFAGTLHFLKPAMYTRIVPPYLPWHLALVYGSGAAEILGGISLFISPVRRPAALGLMALLIAVFPANIYMATDPIQAGAASIPLPALWGRLLLQPIFIWWLWWSTKPRERQLP